MLYEVVLYNLAKEDDGPYANSVFRSMALAMESLKMTGELSIYEQYEHHVFGKFVNTSYEFQVCPMPEISEVAHVLDFQGGYQKDVRA